MNKYRITNPNNKEVRDCKSRTTDSLEVSIKGIEKDKIAEIMLLDITGKSIKKVTYTDNLDIKAISKGTYIIRVISTTNNVYYLKLIKN